MTIHSVEQYLALLRRAQLLRAVDLDRAMGAFRQHTVGNPAARADVDQLATFFVERGYLSLWQSNLIRQGAAKGYYVGKYRRIEPHEAGGIGEGYFAEHTLTRRRALLKRLPPLPPTATLDLQHYFANVKQTMGWQHPHVLQLLGYERDEPDIYFVYEECHGVRLSRQMGVEGRIAPETSLIWILQLAEGLAAAHAKQAIHRRFQPDAILVTREGHTKITDFGLAAYAQAWSDADDQVATALYAAPEAIGNPKAADERSDLYSLGCVATALLTGKTPFKATSVETLGRQHRESEIFGQDDLIDWVPEEIARVLVRLLEKDPAARWPSAREFCEAFEPHVSEHLGEQSISSARASARTTVYSVDDTQIISDDTEIISDDRDPGGSTLNEPNPAHSGSGGTKSGASSKNVAATAKSGAAARGGSSLQSGAASKSAASRTFSSPGAAGGNASDGGDEDHDGDDVVAAEHQAAAQPRGTSRTIIAVAGMVSSVAVIGLLVLVWMNSGEAPFVEPKAEPRPLAPFVSEDVAWNSIEFSKPSGPVYCLFDEDAGLAGALRGDQPAQAIEDDVFSGRRALRVEPNGVSNAKLAGLQIPIRKNPKPGEYRYIVYAWKERGGEGIALELNKAVWNGKPSSKPVVGYFAGTRPNANANLREVDKTAPADWTVVRRDLAADFGDFTIAGLGFKSTGGECGLWDYVYLARDESDLNSVGLPQPAHDVLAKHQMLAAPLIVQCGAPRQIPWAIGYSARRKNGGDHFPDEPGLSHHWYERNELAVEIRVPAHSKGKLLVVLQSDNDQRREEIRFNGRLLGEFSGFVEPLAIEARVEPTDSMSGLLELKFKNLGEPNAIVSLIAFLPDDPPPSRAFVPVPLEKHVSAVSTQRLFSGRNDNERLFLTPWTLRRFHGVPFQLIDPQGDRIKNAILFYSPQSPYCAGMPRSVRIPCDHSVTAIHFLGMTAGWGYPFEKDDDIVLIVRLKYADGKTEDHPLRNGRDIVDYIRKLDVPGSEYAYPSGDQQIRYLYILPKRDLKVESMELVKSNDVAAPVVFAITWEVPADT